jgi:predicted MPP superfamily phosphohydrolase
MKIFAIVFILITLSLGLFIGDYLVHSIGLFSRFKITFWILHVLLISTIPIAPFVYRLYPINVPNSFYDSLQYISYVSMGFYFVLFGFVLFNKIGMGSVINLTITDESRRDFIKSSIAFVALGASGIITTLGYITAIKTPEIVKVKIPLTDLPLNFEGLKIVQLSDVHVGQTIKKVFVKKIVDITNSLKPDMIVLTGDFVDGSYFQLASDVDYFKNLTAPLGVYYVPGNHEYYWGVEEWVNIFKNLGFHTLLNEHVIIKKGIDELVVAGVHDLSAHRVNNKYKSSPEEAIKGAPTYLKKILLAHQPKSAYAAEKAGFDLQLSGHSHAGQFFPSSILIYFFQPFVQGLYRYKKLWLYVNRGTGYWGPPNRMGVPSEITLLELTNSTNSHAG